MLPVSCSSLLSLRTTDESLSHVKRRRSHGVGVAQFLGYLRDRPRIEVGVSLKVRLDQPAAIVLTIANHGRQPTTLVKARFCA
jgi:hypothetical protein